MVLPFLCLDLCLKNCRQERDDEMKESGELAMKSPHKKPRKSQLKMVWDEFFNGLVRYWALMGVWAMAISIISIFFYFGVNRIPLSVTSTEVLGGVAGVFVMAVVLVLFLTAWLALPAMMMAGWEENEWKIIDADSSRKMRPVTRGSLCCRYIRRPRASLCSVVALIVVWMIAALWGDVSESGLVLCYLLLFGFFLFCLELLLCSQVCPGRQGGFCGDVALVCEQV